MSDITHLLTQPESRTLEFKRDLSSLRPILRTLVAFANTSGGTLIVGREDDGGLRGLDDVESLEESLANTIADSIEPALLPDVEGTVLEALREVPRFIRRNTRMAARIESMRRQDIPEYPTVALREALTNAVAHADYSQPGMHIQVAIYSDRLEVQSPGTWPFPLTLADFKTGVSRIRNPVITRVLRELELMEEWGSGYLRISEACDQGGYPVPEWVELGSVVRTVFRPLPAISDAVVSGRDDTIDELVNEPVTERQKWFLQRLRSGARILPEDIAQHFGVSLSSARRDIADLRARGWVTFVGPPKTGSYRMAEAVNEAVDELVNEPVNEAVNERQKWFLERVRSGARILPADLAQYFGVSLSSAKRDIADLKARGWVTFVGPPKIGSYRAKKPG